MRFSFTQCVLLIAATVADAAKPLGSPITIPALGASLRNNTDFAHRMSFHEIVRTAHIRTITQYPRARLVSVQASTIGDPTDDPEKLQDVRLVFAIPDRSPYQTLIVQMSNVWGSWLAPVFSMDHPPPNHGDLPLDFGMDIVMADLLIKAHGYHRKYWWANVAWPENLAQTRLQVYYIFEMEQGEPGETDAVFVGAIDQSVVEHKYQEALGSGGRGLATS